MGKKWMPITVGVLEIIHGIGGIFLGFLFLVLTSLLGPPDIVINELSAFLLFVCGVLAIIGGVFAIRREIWSLAFIGAILSLAPSVPYVWGYWWFFDPNDFFSLYTLLGFSGVPAIVAIVLTVLSRKQFERKIKLKIKDFST